MPFLVAELVGCEFGVIEFLAGRDQVEDDTGQLVSRRRDGFRCAEFGSYAAVEIAEGAFAVM